MSHWKPEENPALLAAAGQHIFERAGKQSVHWKIVAATLAEQGFERSAAAIQQHVHSAGLEVQPTPAEKAHPGSRYGDEEDQHRKLQPVQQQPHIWISLHARALTPTQFNSAGHSVP